MHYYNLIEPLYVNVALNFNEFFNPRFKKNEEFKYKVTILCSKVILAVSPCMVKDIFQFRAYLEMQSYIKALKRYRPLLKIETILQAERKRPGDQTIKSKKRALIRDWFRLVLWYVRLRRASRAVNNKSDYLGKSGWMPSSLLKLNAKPKILDTYSPKKEEQKQ